MQYLAEYAIFLLKITTITAAVLIMVAGIVAIISKGKARKSGKITITNLKKKLLKRKDDCISEILSKKELKHYFKEQKKANKKTEPNKRLFVVRFHGDVRASMEKNLEQEITTILSIANQQDEVLVCLESGGGMVPHYGLCASQLMRLRNKKINLTVAIDKIAASGGYLMASVANKIIAAPFAIIGSIGVIAQVPNFHRLLKEKNIDFEQVTSGKHKRTLTVFGENTSEARNKLQQELEDVHEQFKQFILKYRPTLDLEQIATGEYWLAERALGLQLVDELGTSEDFLMNALNVCTPYEVRYHTKKKLAEKFSDNIRQSVKQFMQFDLF